jgi:phosphatidylserine/phosphatidylglycerophosphate/cardiolipin synthase-like enzyme
VRTIPAGFYAFADKGHYGIHHALITAIQEAEHFIYLENQYIWAPEVVDALISAMNRPRQNPFRIVLVLPSHAYSGRYDNDRHVEDLRTADGGRGIFESYALYAGGPAAGRTGYRYNPIYVHAKVSIVDDAWFSIGSANLNRRGLGTDTEMNVQAISLETARRLRVRLWAEHLGVSDGNIGSEDPIELIDNNWKDVGQRTAGCIRAGSRPETGQVVRYVTKRGAQGRVLDILQSMSLEH